MASPATTLAIVVTGGDRPDRALLDALGLRSFLKTSGGKGLHVVVPLAPKDDWDTVKDFSEAIVQHMAATLPQLFVAKSGPKNRVQRIFIDYLRNGRGATTAAAFGLRARPGLGVSMPVAWDELEALESAAHWRIADVDAADGTEGRLFATPVFSPSGQRLVVSANGFGGHGHEIATWDRRDGHWAEGGRFGGGAGRPVEEWTFRGWEGEDLIRFDYALVDPPGQPGKVEMRWDGGGWQVIQRPPVTSSGLQQGGAGGQ